jgi:23S rRNA (guanosine2251-2'-O)-methyltransferase
MNREPQTFTGFHAVFELLRGADAVDGTLYLAGNNAKIRDARALAEERGIAVVEVSAAKLREIAGDQARHVAFVGSAERRGVPKSVDAFLAAGVEPGTVVLLLDGVTDPQNYGAILRSADQFGVDLVVMPNRRSAHETDAVARASAGAVASVNVVREANLANAVRKLQDAGFWVYAADMDGTPAWECDLSGNIALILGSEGKGVSKILREAADQAFSIPTGGTVDSLNVSVAAGVSLYEVYRQRHSPS